jgi:hypothetical protein
MAVAFPYQQGRAVWGLAARQNGEKNEQGFERIGEEYPVSI